MAVAEVPFARVTAVRRSVAPSIDCIHGARPGVTPKLAAWVRGSTKKLGPAIRAA
jgi:hypothetical protein